jgi:hypothetical protein
VGISPSGIPKWESAQVGSAEWGRPSLVIALAPAADCSAPQRCVTAVRLHDSCQPRCAVRTQTHKAVHAVAVARLPAAREGGACVAAATSARGSPAWIGRSSNRPKWDRPKWDRPSGIGCHLCSRFASLETRTTRVAVIQLSPGQNCATAAHGAQRCSAQMRPRAPPRLAWHGCAAAPRRDPARALQQAALALRKQQSPALADADCRASEASMAPGSETPASQAEAA